MTEYKRIFTSRIYNFDYNKLVASPKSEIESLVSWLGWDWNDSFLSPHLKKRIVATASNIQVRQPINSRSIGGWVNYQKLLEPAIDILIRRDKFKNLIKSC